MKNSVLSLLFSFLFSILFSIGFAQTITTVDPDSGYQGQVSLQVNITGTNLNFTQASSVIMWLKQGTDSIGDYNSDWTSQNSASGFFNFSLSASTGFYDLYCFNTISSETAVLQNGFEILPALPAPDAAVLISPVANSILDNTVITFDWSIPINAHMYELRVDNDPLFSSPLVQSVLQINSYSNPNLSLNNGVYFWKVRAKNVSGIWGNWSSVNSFTLNAVPQIIAVNPNNGYVGQTLGVNISGVNTHFTQASSLTDFLFQQQAFTFAATSISGTSDPFNIGVTINIPGSAPAGYYNVIDNIANDSSILYNAFYVHPSNQFSGTIFIDANNNQVYDMGEVPYSQGIISNSFNSSFALSQLDGTYEAYAPAGNFTFSLVNPPLYYSFSPSQYTHTFSGTGEAVSGNDFALSPVPGIHDLRITGITGNSSVRPGFDDMLIITAKNMGNSIESGSISLSFPSSLTVVSSSSSYTISANTITWNYTGLQPFATEQISLILNIPVSVQIGSFLSFTGEVSGAGQDTTPFDNVYILQQMVVNSFDPNIKEVSPAAGLTPQQVADGEYLQYTIHFQNTGTAEAINIRILDTLNQFLDITTFEVLAASHSWQAGLLENRLAEFRFDNINLPDSNANELLSHGFIKYRIKPASAFAIGDRIENTAHIYFDFNEAIVTNTTNTEIITGVEEQPESKFNLQVSPNPFNAQTTISYKIAQPGFLDIKLYNSNGQLVKIIFNGQQQIGNHKMNLNLQDLSTGVYYISLNSNSICDIEKLLLLK